MTEVHVPTESVARLRSLCHGFPDASEEQAWVAARCRVGGKTFAHVLAIDAGWPPDYARAANTDGPDSVLMLRSSGSSSRPSAGPSHCSSRRRGAHTRSG
jgi:hypothetical protein